MDKKSISLIGRKTFRYNEKIEIIIPTVNQIRWIDEVGRIAENQFWQEVNLFTLTPTDYMSELDSIGIDFTQLSDYNFFILTYLNLKSYFSSLNRPSQIFKGFNFWALNLSENEHLTLNDGDDVIINEAIYKDLSDLICYMTCRERTPPKKFGNDYAKKKRIEQDYKKKERLRQKNGSNESNFFDKLILRLVCTADFPYNFATIGEISLFEFMYSLKQIDKNISVDNLISSGYYGNDLKKYSADDLSRYVI